MDSKLVTPLDVISLACDSCGIAMHFDITTLRRTLDKNDMIQGKCIFCHRIMVISKKRLQEIEDRL
jgi:hypothetical protein